MFRKTKRDAFAYWEKRRVIYNVLLVPPSLFAWQISSELTYHIDEQAPARLTDLPVLLALVGLCIGANLCYSFVYVLEFLFLAESPGKLWPKPGRTILLILGCVLGMWLASSTMSQLQINMAGPLLPYEP